MRRQYVLSSVLLLSLSLSLSLALGAGCNPATTGDTTMPDLGMTPTDAGTMPMTDAGPGCGMNVIPTSGFGTTIGRNFTDLTLPTCPGSPQAGADYDFYNQDYCTSTITVLTIAAGWCHPCNLEADQLETMMIMPYASRGVRVVQVLTQNDTYGLPTTAGFCDSWITRHHLSYTDHVTLLDPDGLTQIYNPASSIPATIIIDGDGKIQQRFNGVSTDATSGMAALTEATGCLDKLLGTPRMDCF